MARLLEQSSFYKVAQPFRALACLCCAGSLLMVVWTYGPSAQSVEYAAFTIVLFAITLNDMAWRIIPDRYIGMAIAVRLAYLAYAVGSGALGVSDTAYFALSALGLGVALACFVLLADAVFGGESMGGGDVKLYSVAALYFGWQVGLLVMVLSCVISIAIALVVRLAAPRESRGSFMKASLPFAPSIALSCMVVMALASPAFAGAGLGF